MCDATFPERAKAAGESIVVGGSNYGQGSSREHAALVPMYLGVRAVIAKSFARIHVANLINAGILPLTFKNPEDYDALNQGDALALENIHAGMDAGEIVLKDLTTGQAFPLSCDFTERQKDMSKSFGFPLIQTRYEWSSFLNSNPTNPVGICTAIPHSSFLID